MILQGALLVGEILLLPYQAYELWFDLFRSGMAKGRVSHLFVKLGALLTVLACWIAGRQKKPLEGIRQFLYLPLFFLFLLAPSFWTGLLFIAALLGSRYRRDNARSLALLLLFALPFGLTGIRAPAKGARFIDNSSDRFLIALTELWPSLPLLYDIPLYGESFAHSVETGGRPALTTRTIFTVEGTPGERLYLLTGTSPRRGGQGETLFLNGLPREEEAPEATGRSYGIRITADFINMIPYTGDTAYLEWEGDYYLLEGTGATLIPDPPLFMDDTYRLYTIPGKTGILPEEFDFTPYLAPVEEPSPELKTLAASLKGRDEETTANNIRAYLAENYTYTLETEEKRNYTEYFLFQSKEGYCLHFASAFVALARLNGIPCRFSEGYLAIFPVLEDYWEYYGYIPDRTVLPVTGFSSHLWPEVYRKGEGWVRYEATPPFYVPESRTGEDSLTRRQLSEMEGRGALPDGEEEGGRIPPVWSLLLPLPAVLYVMGRRLNELAHRFGRNTLFVIRRYVRLAFAAGIDRPRDTGWRKWGENVAGELPELKGSLEEIMPLILKARYSPEPLKGEEKILLHRKLAEFRKDSRRRRR